MSYDEHDAAMDEMYERIGEELYPGHKHQAVSEFTAERLCSFYAAHPMVMRPAVEALHEARRLQGHAHFAATVVFCATAIELFLKATLLKPVVHGLVHNIGLADIIVQHAVGQAGFDRYLGLLSQLFRELADLDLATVRRDGANDALITESKAVQEQRNRIIHQGSPSDAEYAAQALAVAIAVYELIVCPMLGALELTVIEKGEIRKSPTA